MNIRCPPYTLQIFSQVVMEGKSIGLEAKIRAHDLENQDAS